MSAASPTPSEGAGREGWVGTVTWEHSYTVISGSAIRHSCRAINTSFGDGLQGNNNHVQGCADKPVIPGQKLF